MRIKKVFFLLSFIAIMTSLLTACNLRVTKPDSNLTPTLSIEVSVILTVTAMSASSSTPVPTSTPAITLTPSPTTTLFFAPTATSTQQWAACPGIVVTLNDTKKGDMLHVLRCEDGLEYDLGPLAKGFYAVGPNDKFLVYVTIDGFVYASRIGDSYMYNLYDLAYEHIFTAFNKRITPDFDLSFVGERPNYKLILLEKNYDQKRVYDLPSRITK